MSVNQQRAFTQTHAVLLLLGSGLIYTLSALGGFEFIDGQAQDYLSRLLLRWKAPHDGVLLVPASREYLKDPEKLTSFLRALERFQPRGLAFTSIGAPSTPDLDSAIAQLPFVVLPESDDAQVEGSPPGASIPAPSTPRGAFALPPLEAGVARKHKLHPSTSTETIPSLELAVALGVSPTLADGPLPPEVYVDFRGGSKSLPSVSMEGVISGNVHSDLMTHKCILVGPSSYHGEPGLITPTTVDSPGMTSLEYSGNVLSTLLGRTWSLRAAPWLILVATAISTAVSVALQLSFRLAVATLLSIVSVAGFVGLCAFLHLRLGIWLPPTAPALTMALATVVTIHMRASLVEGRFRELAAESEAAVKDNPITSAQVLQGDTLARILKTFQDVIGTQRTLLLGVTKKSELTELAAVGCSGHDISPAERRKDHPHFRVASESNAPLLVDGLLPRSSEDERLFVAPVRWQNQALAFLLFTLEGELSSATLQDTVLDATSRLAQVLANTSVACSNAELAREILSESLHGARSRGADPLLKNLSDLSAAAELAAGTLASVSASIAVFDVFGCPVYLNSGLQALLAQEGIAPSAMSLRDLLATLTNIDTQRIQSILQSLFLHDRPFAAALVSPTRPQDKKAMILRPLPRTKFKGAVASSMVPSRAILCQIIDTAEIASLYTLKTDLLEKLSSNLRSNLSDINLCAFLLDREDSALEPSARQGPRIQKTVRSAIRSLTDCARYFAAAESPADAEAFPVNPAPALLTAVNTLKESADRQQVQIKVEHPRFPSHVLANPQVLEQLFENVLQVLLGDASENTSIDVRLDEHRDTVTFSFANKGFGIPDDLLQSYLRADHDLRSDHLTSIRDVLPTLSAWNATLEAHSRLGSGYNFDLHLVRFL